jgi:hypothetical protein
MEKSAHFRCVRNVGVDRCVVMCAKRPAQGHCKVPSAAGGTVTAIRTAPIRPPHAPFELRGLDGVLLGLAHAIHNVGADTVSPRRSSLSRLSGLALWPLCYRRSPDPIQNLRLKVTLSRLSGPRKLKSATSAELPDQVLPPLLQVGWPTRKGR